MNRRSSLSKADSCARSSRAELTPCGSSRVAVAPRPASHENTIGARRADDVARSSRPAKNFLNRASAPPGPRRSGACAESSNPRRRAPRQVRPNPLRLTAPERARRGRARAARRACDRAGSPIWILTIGFSSWIRTASDSSASISEPTSRHSASVARARPGLVARHRRSEKCARRRRRRLTAFPT